MRRFLQPWEISMLRRLSIEWLVESQRAEDPDSAAPWGGGVTDEELRSVAANLKAEMRRMAK